MLVRAVSGYYESHAARQGKSRPRAGAVAWAQRFDSALRLDVHFHVLWADGVFAHDLSRSGAEFCEHGEVTDADVAKLVAAIQKRVLGYLRRAGKLPAAGEEAVDVSAGGELLVELGAAAVPGRAARGAGANGISGSVAGRGASRS
jgi:hypothetical protein